jgi:hypothetical protein
MASNTELAKAIFRAYEMRDRTLAERLLAPDFTFTSPYDDHIGLAAYFARCWPNSKTIRRFDFVAIAEAGDGVFVLYDCEAVNGDRFRNTEYFTVKNGKLASVDVFFGDPPSGVTREDYPAFVDVGKQAWEQRLHSM